MILKTGIEKFTNYYHRYIWLINIPFTFYFAISLNGIAKMKSEINIMQEVLIDQAGKNIVGSQKSYECASFIANKTHKRRSAYKAVKSPLQKVQDSGFIQSEDWLGEVENLENLFQEFLEVNETVFEFDRRELQWGNKYPAVRSYITSKYACQIINILYIKMHPGSSSCYLCSWFYPIVQKCGDDLLLYPNVIDACEPKYNEYWVNDVKLDKKIFRFKPAHRGLHSLNIEYKYLNYQGSPEVLSVRKDLLVH